MSRPDIPARPGLPPPPHSSTPVPVPLQRSAVVPFASARPAPAPAAVPVQRRTSGGGPPVPGSLPRNDGGARLPTAGAFAVAAGVAQRMPDGSVVFGSAAAPPSGTSRPVVQRDAELTEEPPPPDPDSTSASDPVPNAEPEPVGESDTPAPRRRRAGEGGHTRGDRRTRPRAVRAAQPTVQGRPPTGTRTRRIPDQHPSLTDAPATAGRRPATERYVSWPPPRTAIPPSASVSS